MDIKKENVSWQKVHRITDDDIRITDYCQKYLLLNDNEPWKKKDTGIYFKVTISCYDGVLICKVFGINILNGFYNYIHSHTFFPSNMKWKNAYDKITGNKNFATFSSLTQEIDTHDCMFLSCHIRVSEWIHTL